MNPLMQLRLKTPVFLVALTVACFALSQSVPAVYPPPDGGYPNNNTAEGENALFNLTTGFENTAIGFRALFSITGSYSNTAIGFSALSANRSGNANTATGAYALQNNELGNENTATGQGALAHNTRGSYNTATGVVALVSNTNGSRNTATGSAALSSNTTGNYNTANGVNALLYNTTGNNNTATGSSALFNNTTGQWNTANGVQALFHNTTGYKNSATGSVSLFLNTAGHDNIAVGVGALPDNTTGSFNLAVGNNAGAYLTTGNDNIDIGSVGVAGESNTIRIGSVKQTATFIAGISGASVPGGVGVIIDSSGHLGTIVSSERFKVEIEPMDRASEAILALKPVTFRYKRDLDPDGIPQFGLIAEQVEKVNPHLVVKGEDGKVMTVRYEAVNAMLLNEFLKEHRKNEEQQSKIEQQGATIARQQKQIEALTAGLQKVNAQLELSGPAPQLAESNQ